MTVSRIIFCVSKKVPLIRFKQQIYIELVFTRETSYHLHISSYISWKESRKVEPLLLLRGRWSAKRTKGNHALTKIMLQLATTIHIHCVRQENSTEFNGKPFKVYCLLSSNTIAYPSRRCRFIITYWNKSCIINGIPLFVREYNINLPVKVCLEMKNTTYVFQ